jgi:hypothetical protein
MPDLAEYGITTKTFPFTITKNGAPVDVTLDTNDVWLVIDNVGQTDISSEISKVNAGTPHVSYYWQPTSAAQLQASDNILLSIVDYSGGGAFDANRIVLYTGGNVSARYSG